MELRLRVTLVPVHGQRNWKLLNETPRRCIMMTLSSLVTCNL
jgi:hypothetical protein